MVAWNKGKHLSEEHRRKLSLARKKGFEEGKIKSWNKGSSPSEENKKRLDRTMERIRISDVISRHNKWGVIPKPLLMAGI